MGYKNFIVSEKRNKRKIAMFKKYIILCEAGWHNARELSLEMSRKNMRSSVLIKGRPDKEARQMISRHKLISNIFIPDKFFAVFVYLYISLSVFFAKELVIFFNREKSYNMLSIFKKAFAKVRLEKVPVKK